ncbi:hypothetical protein CLAFUW4_11378 [Fulvia fulva]|uniref:F-box domain-containing protein n=1 Tax=Passalora fulva TaxID=5499 RepID=A0A9Q8PDF3_PASFU|nr:uncharacterized protein CLAFUR5_10420 [Fulvia fulva]KAK4619827.1 hypothetical protein CLAFUR4_11384 [Fulvia fulva]KAK4621037.1 hypothetical protein CLAFUR0_11390 [Fulvia fulva]UJO20401.1 hypothetical protein CLAFUR5_10420 [Fulvia fulva]WPV16883.1 hypothetical protein CLAFUW4_11378 [Fulvia fulva]WPV31842.1 hypothetical protein CLAFUW7_11374 [Fulvia fulva]
MAITRGVTKAAGTAAAIGAVFGTTELLEMILLYLQVNELLCAQQICTRWRDTIRASTKIQQTLYLSPFGDKLVHAIDDGPGPKNFDLDDWNFAHWIVRSDKGSDVVVRPILNPIMHRYFFTWYNNFVSILKTGFIDPIFDRSAYHESCKWKSRNPLPEPCEDDIGPRTERQLLALHREGASWRRMYVMQPPCSHITIMCDDQRSTFTITNEKGVTLQDLRDGVYQHWSSCRDCPTAYVIERWDFEGFRLQNLQLLKEIPTSIDLLNSLRRPNIVRLPGVLD